MPAIEGGDRVVERGRFLLETARLLGVPILATEQYRKGLGATVDELLEYVGAPIEKVRFGGGDEPPVLEWLRERDIGCVAIVGIEAHVCVSQTAFELAANGLRPFVAADAVGSRRGEDKAIALARLAQQGIVVATTEAIAFEWMETAAAPEFKAFSQLVKAADAADRAFAWRPMDK